MVVFQRADGIDATSHDSCDTETQIASFHSAGSELRSIWRLTVFRYRPIVSSVTRLIAAITLMMDLWCSLSTKKPKLSELSTRNSNLQCSPHLFMIGVHFVASRAHLLVCLYRTVGVKYLCLLLFGRCRLYADFSSRSAMKNASELGGFRFLEQIFSRTAERANGRIPHTHSTRSSSAPMIAFRSMGIISFSCG